MPLYDRPPNMLLGMLPEWLRPDPASDATSMITPLGMAGFAGKTVPLFRRLAPSAQGVPDSLFTPEEQAVQESIINAARSMQDNPYYQRLIQTNLARGQAETTGAALDAALQRARGIATQQKQYGDLLDLLLMKTRNAMGR